MPLSASVREYMSSILHIAPRDVSLDHAVNMMARLHIRHIPLVEGGRIVAVLTPEDIARQIMEAGGLAHVPVELPERPLPAIDLTATVAEAAKLMWGSGVDYVIVGPLTAPSGILSSRDVVRASQGELGGYSVSRCMDEAPPSVPLDASLAGVARKLLEAKTGKGYPARHVIVGVGGLPIGVVSVRDFIYYVAVRGTVEGRVTDVMSPYLYYLDPASSLEEAVEEMVERDVGFLPVVYKAKVLGGVYEFTIVKAVAGGSCE